MEETEITDIEPAATTNYADSIKDAVIRGAVGALTGIIVTRVATILIVRAQNRRAKADITEIVETTATES